MILQGLQVSRLLLDDIAQGEFDGRQKVANERLRKIREHDVIKTQINHPSCKCPVYPGMTVEALMRLGAGCTAGDGWNAGYVCNRLVSLRRIYGH